MSDKNHLPIAISCGDPAGIGPEIVENWLLENPERQDDVCVIGSAQWLKELSCANRKAVGDFNYVATPGEPSEAGARIAVAALEEAAQGCVDGRYRSVTTSPISKWWLNRVGWSFPGQTEFFAHQWKGEPTMAFAGGKLRVVLATRHIPLVDVLPALNEDVLRKTITDAAFLAQRLDSKSQANIGVCGLNPHAGEGGLIGREEIELIDPILDKLRQSFPGLSKSLPADTLFWRYLQGDFDVIVALYHDQGLIPLKTLDFDTSVNISLGLPFIRTSPDHGTAFNIAGRGIASTTSFSNAVKLADALADKS